MFHTARPTRVHACWCKLLVCVDEPRERKSESMTPGRHHLLTQFWLQACVMHFPIIVEETNHTLAGVYSNNRSPSPWLGTYLYTRYPSGLALPAITVRRQLDSHYNIQLLFDIWSGVTLHSIPVRIYRITSGHLGVMRVDEGRQVVDIMKT